jgi:nitrogen regulatory protein P-II 2
MLTVLPLPRPVPARHRSYASVAVKNEMVEQVIESVISSAHTGRVGDGKVFVTDLPQVVRIRNRETGDAAL